HPHRRAAHARTPSDPAPVEQHGVLDLRAALDHDAVAEDRVQHDATAYDRAVGDERVQCLALTARRIGGDLRRPELAGRRADRPPWLVEIERGTRCAEV